MNTGQQLFQKAAWTLSQITPIQELRDQLITHAMSYEVLVHNTTPLPDGRIPRNAFSGINVTYDPLPAFGSDGWVHVAGETFPGIYVGTEDIDNKIHLIWINYEQPRDEMEIISVKEVDFFGTFQKIRAASLYLELIAPDEEPRERLSPKTIHSGTFTFSSDAPPEANGNKKKKKKKSKKKKGKTADTVPAETEYDGLEEAVDAYERDFHAALDKIEREREQGAQKPAKEEPMAAQKPAKEEPMAAQKPAKEEPRAAQKPAPKEAPKATPKETYEESYEEESSSDESVSPSFLRNNPFFMGEEFESKEPKRSISSKLQKLHLDDSDETPSESPSGHGSHGSHGNHGNHRDTESDSSTADTNARVNQKTDKNKVFVTYESTMPKDSDASSKKPVDHPPKSTGKLTHRQLKSRQASAKAPENEAPRTALIPTLTARFTEDAPESHPRTGLIPTLTARFTEDAPESHPRTGLIPTLTLKSSPESTPEKHPRTARIPTLRVKHTENTPESRPRKARIPTLKVKSGSAPAIDKTARIPLVQAQRSKAYDSEEEAESQEEDSFDNTESSNEKTTTETAPKVTQYGKRTQKAFLTGLNHGKSIAINDDSPAKQIKDLARASSKNLVASPEHKSAKDSIRIFEELKSSTALKIFFAASEESMFSQYFPELQGHFTSFHKESQNLARGLLEEFPFLKRKRNLEATHRKDLAYIISTLIGRPKIFPVSMRRQAGEDASIILLLIRHWTGENADALDGIMDLADAYKQKYSHLANAAPMEENLKLLIDGFSGKAAIQIDRWYKEEFLYQPASAREMIESFYENVWSKLDASSRIRVKAISGGTERVKNKILSSIKKMGCQKEDFWEVQVVS
ncbi:hypothetical protein JCM33374_g2551 [Metschnikowia sp. JCM 33374]|nr:hypothetical protein JCM33374_g2551 [Metschnikowia sp. JCM 33374]